eukprot:PLAT15477.2.p1 GENE.PLAT15477.2~~PLAT15477.2.p1  ORF type:complete len:711 (-),score=352.50 PLAT15477.2:26-2158(-)
MSWWKSGKKGSPASKGGGSPDATPVALPGLSAPKTKKELARLSRAAKLKPPARPESSLFRRRLSARIRSATVSGDSTPAVVERMRSTSSERRVLVSRLPLWQRVRNLDVPTVSFKLDLKSGSSKPFVVYFICFTTPDGHDVSLGHRFSEFYALDSDLREAFSAAMKAVPSLPPRFTLGSNLSSRVVEQRRVALAAYLQRLVALSRNGISMPQVAVFLQLDLRKKRRKKERKPSGGRFRAVMTSSSALTSALPRGLRVRVRSRVESDILRATGEEDDELLSHVAGLLQPSTTEGRAIAKFVGQLRERAPPATELGLYLDRVRVLVEKLAAKLMAEKIVPLQRAAPDRSEEALAVDVYICCEHVVMCKVHELLVDVIQAEVAEEDSAITGVLAKLRERYGDALPQDALGIPCDLQVESAWKTAAAVLTTIDRTRSASLKLEVLLSAVGEVHRLVEEELGRDPATLAADDFLPIFIYVVASSGLRRPWTTLRYTYHLASRACFSGEGEYYLTVYESAIYFLGMLEADDEEEEEEEEDVLKGRFGSSSRDSTGSTRSTASAPAGPLRPRSMMLYPAARMDRRESEESRHSSGGGGGGGGGTSSGDSASFEAMLQDLSAAAKSGEMDADAMQQAEAALAARLGMVVADSVGGDEGRGRCETHASLVDFAEELVIVEEEEESKAEEEEHAAADGSEEAELWQDWDYSCEGADEQEE